MKTRDIKNLITDCFGEKALNFVLEDAHTHSEQTK